MSAVENKKIMFISPEYFGIDKIIMQILGEQGAMITWIDERSVKSSFGRALNSISPKLFFYHQSNNYYKHALSDLPDNYDMVFVIKGEMITRETIMLLRKKNPNAQLVLYLYDPIVYVKGILEKTKLYDRVISFEPNDCKKYGFEFRPLFCDIKNPHSTSTIQPEKHYDICFYGTMYGDRFQIVYQIKKYCESHGLSFYSFCFLRGKFMAWYYWLRNSAFRKLGLRSVSFESKSTDEIGKIIASADIILDANDILQKGLTLRTLETLVSGKKMITTNKDIVNYDFYNPNNICVVDREKIDIPLSFIESKYEPVDKEILERYTASGWIKDVFSE